MATPPSRPTEPNVLVIGNDPVLRRGIVAYLGLTALARNVKDASIDADITSMLAGSAWDLIVLDFEGDVDLARLGWLNQVRPDTPILVLNADDALTDKATVISAGASGYLDKGSAAAEWRRAIETVASGGHYYPGESHP